MADLGENCKRAGKGAVSRWEDWMDQKLLGKRWPLEQRGAGCHENIGFERRAVWRPFCLSVLPQRWAFLSLLWYLLGLLPDVPLAYQLSAGWLCAGGRIWGLVQQECCCKHIHLPLYCIRLPETSHWNISWSHSPPETQHLCWVTVSHVVAQHTTVADDIAACKENLNAMVKTWHGRHGLPGI